MKDHEVWAGKVDAVRRVADAMPGSARQIAERTGLKRTLVEKICRILVKDGHVRFVSLGSGGRYEIEAKP